MVREVREGYEHTFGLKSSSAYEVASTISVFQVKLAARLVLDRLGLE